MWVGTGHVGTGSDDATMEGSENQDECCRMQVYTETSGGIDLVRRTDVPWRHGAKCPQPLGLPIRAANPAEERLAPRPVTLRPPERVFSSVQTLFHGLPLSTTCLGDCIAPRRA